MTITSAELLVLANKYSGRSERSLTDYLKNVVHDLEMAGVFLEAVESITLTAGTRSYALSGLTNSFRKPFHLQPLAGTTYYDEMTEISYKKYRERLKQNQGNNRPDEFTVFNETIYLDPPPSATYTTMDIWGPINHGDSVTVIKYTNEFRKCLAYGCAYYIFERYGLTDDQRAISFKALYEEEKQKLIERQMNKKNHSVQYNDLG